MHFPKGIPKLVGMYPVCLGMFFLVELTVRFVDYATFPWYRNRLELSLYAGFLASYVLVGTAAGLCCALLARYLTGRIPPDRFSNPYVHMAGCQAVLAALYIGIFLYDSRIMPVLWTCMACGAAGTLLFLVLGFFTARMRLRNGPWTGLLAALAAVDILVVGGIFIWKRYTESVRAQVHYPLTVSLPVLAAVCLAVCLIPHALRERPRLKYLFVAGFGCLVVYIAGVSFWGRTREEPAAPAPAGPERPSVVIITMDTTRRDHVSCYGYHRKTTPNIDRLAADGVLFENAYSTSSWTLPAHASLFTGLYPSQHGAYVRERETFGNDLSEEHVTMAELFSENGYTTAGVIGGYVCSSFFGLAQGFDFYDENLVDFVAEFKCFLLPRLCSAAVPVEDFMEQRGLGGKRTAPQINRAALQWLGKQYAGPFLLFLNYFDPHHPYLDNGARLPGPDGRDIRSYYHWEGALINEVLSCRHDLTEHEKRYLIGRYDSEITNVDSTRGEMVQFLKEKDIYDTTLIVVTSDHGESFGEHGLMIHTPAVYEELVRVPLVVKYPAGRRRQGRVKTPVSLTDVLPEVLTVAGIPVPDRVRGTPFSEKTEPVLVERYNESSWEWTCHPFAHRALKAYYRGPYKYIRSSDNNHELFHLGDDPAEQNNLIDILPDIASAMDRELAALLGAGAPLPPGRKTGTPPREALERLKALGYIRE